MNLANINIVAPTASAITYVVHALIPIAIPIIFLQIISAKLVFVLGDMGPTMVLRIALELEPLSHDLGGYFGYCRKQNSGSNRISSHGC